MSRSLRSTEGGPRIPPRVAFAGCWGLYWLMLPHLFALGRFWGACSGFCAVSLSRWTDFGASWRAPGSILEGSGRFGGGFWCSRTVFFELFVCMRAGVVEKLRMGQNRNFNGSQHTSHAMCATPSTVKNRSGTLADQAAYHDRGQDAS